MFFFSLLFIISTYTFSLFPLFHIQNCCPDSEPLWYGDHVSLFNGDCHPSSPRTQQISVKHQYVPVLNRPCPYFNKHQSLQQTSKQLFIDFCHFLSLKRTLSTHYLFKESWFMHQCIVLCFLLIKQLHYHCFKMENRFCDIIFLFASGFMEKKM